MAAAESTALDVELKSQLVPGKCCSSHVPHASEQTLPESLPDKSLSSLSGARRRFRNASRPVANLGMAYKPHSGKNPAGRLVSKTSMEAEPDASDEAGTFAGLLASVLGPAEESDKIQASGSSGQATQAEVHDANTHRAAADELGVVEPGILGALFSNLSGRLSGRATQPGVHTESTQSGATDELGTVETGISRTIFTDLSEKRSYQGRQPEVYAETQGGAAEELGTVETGIFGTLFTELAHVPSGSTTQPEVQGESNEGAAADELVAAHSDIFGRLFSHLPGSADESSNTQEEGHLARLSGRLNHVFSEFPGGWLNQTKLDDAADFLEFAEENTWREEAAIVEADCKEKLPQSELEKMDLIRQMQDWELQMYALAVVDKASLLHNARAVNRAALGRRRREQAAWDAQANAILMLKMEPLMAKVLADSDTVYARLARCVDAAQSAREAELSRLAQMQKILADVGIDKNATLFWDTARPEWERCRWAVQHEYEAMLRSVADQTELFRKMQAPLALVPKQPSSPSRKAGWSQQSRKTVLAQQYLDMLESDTTEAAAMLRAPAGVSRTQG